MNAFDRVITEFVIKFFSRSDFTVHAIYFISKTNLLKGGLFAIMIWYLWFKVGPSFQEKRAQLLATLISLLFVIAVALTFSALLPFRQRPFLNPDFSFGSFVPTTFYLRGVSSFPSDHAAVFISLATGFFLVSRKIGLMAIFYTFLFIIFPRLYLGFHYPTDLLAGAVIGASITWFFNRSTVVKKIISTKLIPFTNNYPWYFYPLLFIFTYEIAEIFQGAKEILISLHGLTKNLL